MTSMEVVMDAKARNEAQALVEFFSNLEIANILQVPLEEVDREFSGTGGRMKPPDKKALIRVLIEHRYRKAGETRNPGDIYIPRGVVALHGKTPIEALVMRCVEITWSIRTGNVLLNERIDYVYQLAVCQEAELLGLKNFGRKCLNEVKQVLGEAGLSLGTPMEDSLIVEAKRLVREQATKPPVP